MKISGKYGNFGYVFCGGDVEENGLFSGSSRARELANLKNNNNNNNKDENNNNEEGDKVQTILYEGNTRVAQDKIKESAEDSANKNENYNNGMNSLHSNPFILCLHSLSHSIPQVAEVSTKIIHNNNSNNNSGISYCSLEDALSLVENHITTTGSENDKTAANNTISIDYSDFIVIVGYSGWAPNQLQQEVDRSSWKIASVDPKIIMNNVINKDNNDSSSNQYDRPIVDDKFVLQRGGDGINSWKYLMDKINNNHNHKHSTKDVLYSFDDMMLRLWIRNRISGVQIPQMPKLNKNNNKDNTTYNTKVDQVPVGTLLLSTPFSSFALHHQYMHKAIILVVESTKNYSIGIILNRPLNTMANFILPGVQGNNDNYLDNSTDTKSRDNDGNNSDTNNNGVNDRRVSFGGEMFNNDAVLLLHRRGEECGGRKIGNSTIYQHIHNNNDTDNSVIRISDLILTRGFTIWYVKMKALLLSFENYDFT